jgi:hypothetical protein
MTDRLAHLRPTSLDGVKRLARQIGKRDGCSHGRALNLAAEQAGFANFGEASITLRAGEKPPQ